MTRLVDFSPPSEINLEDFPAALTPPDEARRLAAPVLEGGEFQGVFAHVTFAIYDR
ncbi:MAG: hypothetical protein HOP19_23965, partial [Acidobacteria bacterium]|nr:hypothetical protein [Acidobacteriota bacterium]